MKIMRLKDPEIEYISVKVTGIPRVEYKKNSAIGDIVLDAKTLERNKRKLEPVEEAKTTKATEGEYLEDKGIIDSGHTYMTTKITEEIIDRSCGADNPQEIPNDQD